MQARRSTTAVALISLLVGTGLGFLLSQSDGQANAQPAQMAPDARRSDAANRSGEPSPFRKLDRFARALALIERHYVRAIDDDALIDGAIEGMTQTLDPHSSFWPPRESELFRQEIAGRFGGIGVAIRWHSGLAGPPANLVPALPPAASACREVVSPFLEITQVVERSPAAQAGLRIGDAILAIDGEPIGLFTSLETIVRVRGPVGTGVSLTVQSQAGIRRDLRLVRAAVVDNPVTSKSLGQGIGWFSLHDFSVDCARALDQALHTMQQSPGGLQAVVLDLRGNGGGLLNEAVGIVDLFVAKGDVVKTRARDQALVEKWQAHRGQDWEEIPLTVLVDETSASASEIVAGALQDHRRALVIGARTYGKGSVQVPFELGDGSTLKLTVALYYTPRDRLIQASGIEPDITASGTYVAPPPQPSTLPTERDEPRHLRPQDFGWHADSPAVDPARAAAGSDAALRVAVEHLLAWQKVDPRVKKP